MRLLDKLRMRFGLRWASKLPSSHDLREFIRGLAFTALLLIAYGAVAHIDDLSERVIVMEQVTDIYEAKVATLEACESGKSNGYFYESDGRVFECPKKL